MSQDIWVIESQVITVEPAGQTVHVSDARVGPQGPIGPEGPQGEQGPPGANGTAINYSHTQVVPASSWIINHNLGYRPNVHVEDDSGVDLMPAIIQHSITQMELQFNVPRSGVANLS